MKKLVIIFSLSMLFVILMIFSAFFYIASTGHKTFRYDLFFEDRKFGAVKVDKYVTEDKIILKSSSTFYNSLGYPSVKKELFLDKRTGLPVKYTARPTGIKGAVCSLDILQKGDRTSALYLDPPVFFELKDFETGEDTILFAPEDPMFYMALMHHYNFWKKGAQFFEVMIPMEAPVPVLRDKIEVRYDGDAYTPIMGKRIETERFIISGSGVPSMTVDLAKYSHSLVSAGNNSDKTRFVLTELPGRFEKILAGDLNIYDAIFSPGGVSPEPGPRAVSAVQPRTIRTENVFFESGKLLLSGRLRTPDGDGPFPILILISNDGLLPRGVSCMFDALAGFLCDSGIAVFDFDSPGRGKSQGNFLETDDFLRVECTGAAYGFVAKHPLADPTNITLAGVRGGGFIAMSAAEKKPAVSGCIILGLPVVPTMETPGQPAEKDYVQKYIKQKGYGKFDPAYMKTVNDMMAASFKNVQNSNDDVSFFMGRKLPAKAYREYLKRKPYALMIGFDRPFLLIFGKDDISFYPGFDATLKTAFDAVKTSRIAVFRNLGPYMGEVELVDGEWRFKINPDVARLIANWIKERQGAPAQGAI